MNIYIKKGVVYMPPFSGKTSLMKRLRDTKSQISIIDTDYWTESHFRHIQQEQINLSIKHYDIVLTNRIELDCIDLGLIPSRMLLCKMLENELKTMDNPLSIEDIITRLKYNTIEYQTRYSKVFPCYTLLREPTIYKDCIKFPVSLMMR